MMWYYADSGKQAGPVSDEELEGLRRQGKVTDETLVWREGMANWQPYREAHPEPAAVQAVFAAGALGPEAPAPEARAASPAGPGFAAEAICGECGKGFLHDDVIRYGDVWVCAACKPAFVQKLKEGVRVGGGLDHAGFWTRFSAAFVDGILLYVVDLAIFFALGFSLSQTVGLEQVNLGGAIILQVYVIPTLVSMTYEVLMVGKYGATLGKMACKIKVVTAAGGPITYGRAFGRYWAKLLSSMTLLIGFLMAAFDLEKRALHDHVCATRVIRV